MIRFMSYVFAGFGLGCFMEGELPGLLMAVAAFFCASGWADEVEKRRPS